MDDRATKHSRYAANVAGILGACAVGIALGVSVGCQGPQPFFRGGNLITCNVSRQECTTADPATGQCLAFAGTFQAFSGNLCWDPNGGVDLNSLCGKTYCTHDINAPGSCSALMVGQATAPPGVCAPAPAGSGLAEVTVTYHSEHPGPVDESSRTPLSLVNQTLPPFGGPPFCVDLTQMAAVNLLGPPSTDYSRATAILSVQVNSPRCVPGFPADVTFDISPGAVATGSGGSVTLATVTALRGQASVARACPGGGDVCLTTSLDDLHIDVADTTIAGVPLTGVQVATAAPAPLATINDPIAGQYLGVPGGALQLRVTGKMNGADAVFFAASRDPWRVDVSAGALRIRGPL